MPDSNFSIRLAGESVIIDHQSQLANELGTWLPPQDFFRTRAKRSLTSNYGAPRYFEPGVFENPWPELPPLRFGQIQVPIGFSRFTRALFAVDKYTMASVAAQAFGGSEDLSSPPVGSESFNWGNENNSVLLEFDGINQASFEMYLLNPIRVAESSCELWLLPLVDRRYEWQDSRFLITKNRWIDFFEEAFTLLNITGELNLTSDPIGFGVPDRLCATSATPLVNVLDAACLSIGRRYVFGHGLMTHGTSKYHRDWRLDRDNIIAGGQSGTCLPIRKSWVVGRISIEQCGSYGQRAESTDEYQEDHHIFREITLPGVGEGREIEVLSLWWLDYHYEDNAAEPRDDYDTAFQDFAETWSQNWADWDDDEYCVTYGGVVDSFSASSSSSSSGGGDSFLLCGHDDFLVIEANNGNFVTRVHSLPKEFVPKYLVAQWEFSEVQQGPIYVKTPECGIPAAKKNEYDEFEPGVVECELFMLDIRDEETSKIAKHVNETRLLVFNWTQSHVTGLIRAEETGGVYAFSGNANLEEIVQITSEMPDEDGFYDGIIQIFNSQTLTWEDGCVCKVLDANGS